MLARSSCREMADLAHVPQIPVLRSAATVQVESWLGSHLPDLFKETWITIGAGDFRFGHEAMKVGEYFRRTLCDP